MQQDVRNGSVIEPFGSGFGSKPGMLLPGTREGKGLWRHGKWAKNEGGANILRLRLPLRLTGMGGGDLEKSVCVEWRAHKHKAHGGCRGLCVEGYGNVRRSYLAR